MDREFAVFLYHCCNVLSVVKQQLADTSVLDGAVSEVICERVLLVCKCVLCMYLTIGRSYCLYSLSLYSLNHCSSFLQPLAEFMSCPANKHQCVTACDGPHSRPYCPVPSGKDVSTTLARQLCGVTVLPCCVMMLNINSFVCECVVQ